MSNKEIAIIGYSGHAYVVIEAAKLMGLNMVYYCERVPVKNNCYGLAYLGDENDPAFDWNKDVLFHVGIGDNSIRQKIASKVLQQKGHLANIIHPTALISSSVKIGEGNFVSAQVIINAQATIGDFCILNTGCIIEHECKIGCAVHVAPGAVLAGNVTIGNGTFVGANTVIKQGVNIGKDVVIGAGSVVLKDISDNEIWVGNPAKKINK